jgi:high affinity sulfate transporter 1
MSTTTTKQSGIQRILPILGWLPKYDRSQSRADFVAGVTVAALVVPKSLGYAGIAGVPIQNGLYAAAAGALIYAVFGTSRQAATGPSSALAAVAASALVAAGISDGGDATQLVAAIALGSGFLYLLLAVLRMGWISQFLSKAVVLGFLFGAAIEVVVGELPKLTGTGADGDNSWQKLFDWMGSLDGTDATTLTVGLVALAVIIGLRFVAPKVPGALVLVVGGLVASAVLDLGDDGVELVGDVPGGLPSFGVPDLEIVGDNFSVIGIASVALLLIGFSQTAADARTFATKHGYRVDINQESVAQGMANVGAGLVQGIPVSTSLSASSLNDSAGAKTQVASLVTGATVVLTMVALAPLFSDLPKPVLSALIIDAVVFGMMDVAGLRRLFRVKRVDFWIAVAAILGVVGAGVLNGVVIGVILSMIWLVYVNATPAPHELGRRPDSAVFWSIDEHPDAEIDPDLLVMRFDGGLYFVTADGFEDGVRTALEQRDQPVKAVVISFEGIDFIDSQGSSKMNELLDLADQAGIEVGVARIKRAVREVLEADGVTTRLGKDRVFGNVDEAVLALQSGRPSRPTAPANPKSV